MQFTKERDGLIEMAQHKLESHKINSQDYLDFLNNIAKGQCPQCHVELRIIDFKSEGNSTHYKFQCGHGHHDVKIAEKIQVWDMMKMKLKENERKAHLIIKQGNEPSKDPRLTAGVNKYMKVDRKNDKYDQVIIDRKSGEVIHEEHQSLKDHKKEKII